MSTPETTPETTTSENAAATTEIAAAALSPHEVIEETLQQVRPLDHEAGAAAAGAMDGPSREFAVPARTRRSSTIPSTPPLRGLRRSDSWSKTSFTPYISRLYGTRKNTVPTSSAASTPPPASR